MTRFPFARYARRFTEDRDRDNFAKLSLGRRHSTADVLFGIATRRTFGDVLPA